MLVKNKACYRLWSRTFTHQIKIVKYFRGFVHLSHGDQDLVVDVLLVRTHVKAYPRLQGRVHLQWSRGEIRPYTGSSILSIISSTLYFLQPCFSSSLSVFNPTSSLHLPTSHHFRCEVVQVLSPHNVPQVLFDQPLVGDSVCRTSRTRKSEQVCMSNKKRWWLSFYFNIPIHTSTYNWFKEHVNASVFQI